MMAANRMNAIRAALLTTCLGAAVPAFAQTPPTTPPSAPPSPAAQADASPSIAGATTPDQIQDIIVTAQRVEGSLQKTPVSITVFSGRALEEAGSQTVRDLVLSTPNLQETKAIGSDPTNAVFFLRGFGLPRGALGIQPAVGVYIDDFYYPSVNGGLLRLLDLSSIEVLRGPQGTLFGRNTLGGAIRYNTRQPTTDGLSGHLNLEGGSFDRVDFSGAINVPLGETLALRVSGARFKSDGYITDASTGKKVGNQEDDIARAQLRFTPTSAITDDLSAGYSRETFDGSPYILAGIAGDSSGRGGGFSDIYNNGLFVGPPGHQFPLSPPAPPAARYDTRYLLGCKYCQPGSNVPDFAIARILDFHNTLAATLSDALTIKSLTGYFDIQTRNRQDLDYTPVYLVENPLAVASEKAFSQELQFAGSALSSRFHYIAGLYYFHYIQDQTREFGGFSPGPGAMFIVGPVPASATAGDRVATTGVTSDSYAAYAQASFAVTDKLTATLGARYSRDLVQVASQDSVGAPTLYPPKGRFSNFSPAFKLQYQWTPAIMTYASVTRGYRSGSVNTDTTLTPAVGLSAVQPDTLWSYEIGERSQLFDRHLQLNLTAFTSDYHGIQLLYVYPAAAGPVPPTIFANGGDGTVRGIEAESLASVGPFQLRGTAAVLDAYYTKITPPPTDPVIGAAISPITLNSRFQHAPKFTYSIGASWFRDFGGDRGLRLAVDWSHQSSQASTGQDADTQTLPAYGLLNARANLDVARNLQFSVGVQNILNKYYFIGGADLRSVLGGDYLEPGAPRTWSAGVRLKF